MTLTQKSNLTKKASLNAVASVLDYGVRLVVGFIINPLLVSGLGDFGYGIWQVLGRLIGYVTPASGRPTQALKWTVAHQQSSADYHEKRSQVGRALAVWLLFLPLLVPLGLILVWFSPIWLHASPDFYLTVRLAASVLLLNLIATDLSAIPESVLTGENLGYKRMGLSACLSGIGGGLTVLALYLKGGLIGVALATLASTILTGLFFWQVTRTYVTWFGIARPKWGEIRQFFQLSVWFQLWNLVMTLMRSSDVVLLGVLSSAELVTTYSLTKYVPETIINIIAIVVVGVAPGLGGIIGSGNLKKAMGVRHEIMSVTWLIVAVVGSTILLWNQSFLKLWVGASYDAGPLPTLAIVLLVTQLVLIRNDAAIINLTLDLRNKVIIGFVSTTISLVLAGLAIEVFDLGVLGLCLGFLIGRLILSIAYPWSVGRFFGIPFLVQLRGIVRPGLTLLALFAAALYGSHFLQATTWLSLIGSAAVTSGVALAIALCVGLSNSQRTNLKNRGLQLLKRHH
ncbi:MAG TPA: oligosaccharide flippase family protein [Oscillatoriales cyanobacterium M59_W2019_021]|nr:oligosaccharide flippase family protein [Oscillatoriales cyanobacterium M4454_W2019_049]HIK51934.1 oligosaccharide flippase family protein [Oscillatoriales cyanobacterium M59_W2019_021]